MGVSQNIRNVKRKRTEQNIMTGRGELCREESVSELRICVKEKKEGKQAEKGQRKRTETT